MATPPKKKKETNFLPPLLPKKKKTRPLSLVHAEALIDCMKFLVLKLLVTIFRLGYNPLPGARFSYIRYLYRWTEDNICQSIGVEVLWRTCWGTQWELGEQIENMLWTHWGLKGNILGTHWEWGENEEKSLPPLFKLKSEKTTHLECMLGPSQSLHEISLSKLYITIFGQG